MQKHYRLNIEHYLHFGQTGRLRVSKLSHVFLCITIFTALAAALLILSVGFFVHEETVVGIFGSDKILGVAIKYWTVITVMFWTTVFLILPSVYKYFYYKLMLASDGAILGDWQFKADEDCIKFTKFGVSAIYDWTRFNQIYIDDLIVVLWSGPGEGTIIPTHAFSNKAEFDQFVNLSNISSLDSRLQPAGGGLFQT